MSTPTDPDDTRLRLRALLNAQFALILAVCLLLAAAGGGLAYTTHVDPGTEQRSQTVSSWTVESAYDHSAEVTEPNAVFPVGTELQNRSTYFARIAPELDVTARTAYDAASAEDVEVRLRSVLVVRNVGEEVVYWEDREELAATTATDVAAGETVSTAFTLNSTAIANRSAAIEEELGASPGETETFVVTTVELSGTLNGESVTYTRSTQFGLAPGGDTVAVEDPGVASDTTEQTVTETVERSYGPLRSVGGPFLLLVGVAGAGGLTLARRRGTLAITDAERAYLSFRDDRSEFAEWISRVRLPPEAHDRPEATADGLHDLVDFAIDNETGVARDPDTGAFHVVTGEFIYTYRPPPVPPSARAETGASPSADDAADVSPNDAADVSPDDEPTVDSGGLGLWPSGDDADDAVADGTAGDDAAAAGGNGEDDAVADDAAGENDAVADDGDR